MERYLSSTKKSKELWERAITLFPGGISHNIRQFGLPTYGAYPPYITHGDGSHIFDIDGNEYVDWWMTHYSQILGHNNAKVREAITARLEFGIHYGAPNEPQVEYGENLKEAVPILEKMRYTSTGSESTMYAVRLSRLFTGRQLIGKTLGGWHGGNDALTYHMSHPYTDEAFYNGVSFDFNDRDSLDEMLKKYGNEMAAIIVEPVVGAGGGLPPEGDYLRYLREETESRDILLIFDEIVTGFRLRYGTAGDGVFGVKPDLLTLGKAAAGGMPLGVYGGREDVMRLATPGAKGGRWVGGGTFSSHPLTMTSGIAVLGQLKTKKNDYTALNKMGDEFREQLNAMLNELQMPLIGTGYGSINFISFLTHKLEEPLVTPGQLGRLFDHHQQDIFQSLLMQEHVFGYHGLGALSFSHTEGDVEFTLQGIRTAVEGMKDIKS